MTTLKQLWDSRGEATQISITYTGLSGHTYNYTAVGIMPNGDFIAYNDNLKPNSLCEDLRCDLVIDKPKSPRLQAWLDIGGIVLVRPYDFVAPPSFKRLPKLDAFLNDEETI